MTPEQIAAQEAAENAAAEKALAEKDAEEQAVKETAEKTAAEKAAAKKTAKDPIKELLAGYLKRYPKNKVFYVTSDMQVFLEADHNMAVLHQNTLKSGELTTIKQ